MENTEIKEVLEKLKNLANLNTLQYKAVMKSTKEITQMANDIGFDYNIETGEITKKTK